MECVSFFRHFALHYELGCEGFLFGIFIEVHRILGLWLFVMFGFCLRFLLSRDFCSGLVRFLCGLSGELGALKVGFYSKTVGGGKSGLSNLIDEIEVDEIDNLKYCSDVGGEIAVRNEVYGEIVSDSESDDGFVAKNNGDGEDVEVDAKNNEEDDDDDEGVESDIRALGELLKIEHQKVNDLQAELVKERAASATAAEEAMAMILRLQSEKSLLEREYSQHRRLAEEKQIHDQHVIRSLQLLVWQHEFKGRRLFEDNDDEEEEEEEDEARSCLNGNILDALENVLYSSRDSD
ncbi:hypothetical protein SASPL_134350 [Salvia splendens]|uniref:GTD-binding domain-containing protein n=2 Tax=Salvia splendens TaxID=180675 RepID=A0A8X8X7G9_SALSN|nr:hypothetical protein SASPL_134350 [Salvia splendens]